MTRDDLAAHLDYMRELGVQGVSRAAEWRTRVEAPAAADAAPASGETDDMPLEEPHVTTAPDLPAAAAVTLAPAEALAALRHEIGPACTRCKLHTLGRRQVVFGVGNPQARLMFVGEAPGEDEDKQGEPFVGRAGQLLTKIIEAIGMTREQVYIANVIKCRPPGNRNPEPDEVMTCEPYLFEQLGIIRPTIVVALGKFAAQSLLRTTEPITKLRGRVFEWRGASLIPTFHPAYLLRNPPAKREVWEDMKKVRELLQG
ncbi:MAG: uracil-DNA glycosylase [Acidobacteria bacterium]|nr:uracil-DNA glycosylase [Acidobacteriota bacterium]